MWPASVWVKSFVREAYETEKFDKAAEEVRKDFTFVEKILAFNNPTMMFCMYLSMFLVYYLGARIIVNTGATELTTGQLSSLITYGVQILISVMMLSMVFIMTTMASECAERIAEVLTHESSLTSPENGEKQVADGSVDFDHVSFKYSEKSKKFALADIDLHIPSGATVGIIGGTRFFQDHPDSADLPSVRCDRGKREGSGKGCAGVRSGILT